MIETLLIVFAFASGAFGVVCGAMYLRMRELLRDEAAKNFRLRSTVRSLEVQLQHMINEKHLDFPDKDRAGIHPENRVH